MVAEVEVAKTLTDEIFTNLRGLGQRITKERELLILTLDETDKALTPYELHELASNKGEIGLTTTYRLLETLLKNGYVEVFLVNGELRYSLCRPTHHHHLVCTTCYRMQDFDQCDFGSIELRDFNSSSHRLEIFGTCSTCTLNKIRISN